MRWDDLDSTPLLDVQRAAREVGEAAGLPPARYWITTVHGSARVGDTPACARLLWRQWSRHCRLAGKDPTVQWLACTDGDNRAPAGSLLRMA